MTLPPSAPTSSFAQINLWRKQSQRRGKFASHESDRESRRQRLQLRCRPFFQVGGNRFICHILHCIMARQIGFSRGRIRRANNCTLGGFLLSWQGSGSEGGLRCRKCGQPVDLRQALNTAPPDDRVLAVITAVSPLANFQSNPLSTIEVAQCAAKAPPPRKPVSTARNSSVFSIGGTCP